MKLYQEMNDKIADLLLGCEDNGMCVYAGTYIKSLEEQLKSYKDLEEQGKLLKLPCAVDSAVWYIDRYAGIHTEIVRGVVDGYLWYRTCGFALNVVWDKPIMGHFGYKRKEVPFSEMGKTVFLTREEAEAALEIWRNRKNDRKM